VNSIADILVIFRSLVSEKLKKGLVNPYETTQIKC
jgi:hypothetical protein